MNPICLAEIRYFSAEWICKVENQPEATRWQHAGEYEADASFNVFFFSEIMYL